MFRACRAVHSVNIVGCVALTAQSPSAVYTHPAAPCSHAQLGCWHTSAMVALLSSKAFSHLHSVKLTLKLSEHIFSSHLCCMSYTSSLVSCLQLHCHCPIKGKNAPENNLFKNKNLFNTSIN